MQFLAALEAYLESEFNFIKNDNFKKKLIVDRNTKRVFGANGDYVDITTEALLDDGWYLSNN